MFGMAFENYRARADVVFNKGVHVSSLLMPSWLLYLSVVYVFFNCFLIYTEY